VSTVIKERDELTGEASYKTVPRTLFEVKHGLISSLVSPKSSATINGQFTASRKENEFNTAITFLEALHRADPPATGDLYLLIDGDRFQFECTGQRIHVLGDSVIDIEVAQIPFEVLLKISSCSTAKTRVRGIDIDINPSFFSDARSLITELTQDGVI